jgi:phospholipid N-methyltransferase
MSKSMEESGRKDTHLETTTLAQPSAAANLGGASLKRIGARRRKHSHSRTDPRRVALQLSASTKPSNKLWQLFLFARNFIKHPNMVGWMLPSSPFVVDQVLRQVDWQRAEVVVEYGPGLGTFTGPILERMRPDATLVALETNAEFVQFLRRSFHDRRLRLVNQSASEIDQVLQELGLIHADYVISGIPFKTLPHALRATIVRKTHSVLRPRGSFLVYQLSSVVLPYLEKVFGDVSRETELLNFVPARLFYCAR